MNFELNEKQLQLQAAARNFAETELAPGILERDEKAEYDFSLYEKLAKLGMIGLPYPSKFGGSDGDYLDYAICVEEVSKVDASMGISYSVATSLSGGSLPSTSNPREIVLKRLTAVCLQPVPDVRRHGQTLGGELRQQVLQPPVPGLPASALVVVARTERLVDRQEDELAVLLGRHHLARVAVGLDRIPRRGIGRLLHLAVGLGHLRRLLHIPRSFRMRAAIFGE